MEEKKILIADDEVEILQILEKRLRENGYAVKAVSNGKDVLGACAKEKFDLIVLDIAMPDMDGYAVAENLRQDKLLKDIPILFLTGKELEYAGVQKRIEELGAYDFLIKPCTFEEILNKIKEIL